VIDGQRQQSMLDLASVVMSRLGFLVLELIKQLSKCHETLFQEEFSIFRVLFSARQEETTDSRSELLLLSY